MNHRFESLLVEDWMDEYKEQVTMNLREIWAYPKAGTTVQSEMKSNDSTKYLMNRYSFLDVIEATWESESNCIHDPERLEKGLGLIAQALTEVNYAD